MLIWISTSALGGTLSDENVLYEVVVAQKIRRHPVHYNMPVFESRRLVHQFG